MKRTKVLIIITAVMNLGLCSVLWYLPAEDIYRVKILKNLMIIVNTAVLIVGITKVNREPVSDENVYETLLNLSLDGIYIEDERGKILECNRKGYEMFGYTREEMLRLSIRDLVPEEFARALPDIIPEEMATGDRYVERVNKKKNGEIFPTEINSKYVCIGGERRLIVYVRDITVRKQLEDELKDMAMRDELTKIYNRRYIMKRLRDKLVRAKEERTSVAVALLDIDNFKRINDRFGHHTGDEVLIKFSQVIEENLRKTDYLGRVGGEEFIIVFPETVLDEGYGILERVRERLAMTDWGRRGLTVTFSAGLLEVTPEHNQGYSKETLKVIDSLMYRAKGCGRDCIITSDKLADEPEAAAL